MFVSIIVIVMYIIITILMVIGFSCIGYDLGCKETDKAYKNRECRKCSNYKTMRCPNSSECYNTLDKPYFRI